MDSTQPAREAAIALLTASDGDVPDHHLTERASWHIKAAAWQLALDSTVAEPYAVRALDEVRRLIAEDADGTHTDGLRAALSDAQHLADVARGTPAERALAMQERAQTKLAALRLDPGHRRSMPRPAVADPMQPPVSWDELRDGLERELSVLPRDGVLSVHEWSPNEVAARLSRRRDDGRLELEVPDDRYLPSTRRGGPERAAALRRRGWLDPDSVTGGWLCWRWPTPATPGQLADAAVDTLRWVYGVERPERLGVQAVWGSSSARLPMPDLPLVEDIPRGVHGGQRQRARSGRYLVTPMGDRQFESTTGGSTSSSTMRRRSTGCLRCSPGVCSSRRPPPTGPVFRSAPSRPAEPSRPPPPSSWSATASTC
ncbi:MAG: TY-Chap domain-containing protein [Dermatophilaceae bacterium]